MDQCLVSIIAVSELTRLKPLPVLVHVKTMSEDSDTLVLETHWVQSEDEGGSGGNTICSTKSVKDGSMGGPASLWLFGGLAQFVA